MCSCSRYLINSLEVGTSSGDCHCKYIVPTFFWVSIMNCLKNHSHKQKMPCGIRYPSFTFIGPDHSPLYLHNIIIHYPWYFYIYLQNLIDDYTTWLWSLRFWPPQRSGELWSIKGGACWDSMSGLLGFNDKNFWFDAWFMRCLVGTQWAIHGDMAWN